MALVLNEIYFNTPYNYCSLINLVVIGRCGSDLCGILGCYPFTFNNVYLLQWPWAEGIVMYSPGICIEAPLVYMGS